MRLVDLHTQGRQIKTACISTAEACGFPSRIENTWRCLTILVQASVWCVIDQLSTLCCFVFGIRQQKSHLLAAFPAPSWAESSVLVHLEEVLILLAVHHWSVGQAGKELSIKSEGAQIQRTSWAINNDQRGFTNCLCACNPWGQGAISPTWTNEAG